MLIKPRARQNPEMSNSKPINVDVICGSALGLGKGLLGHNTRYRYSLAFC